jgi:hypothetical protein
VYTETSPTLENGNARCAEGAVDLVDAGVQAVAGERILVTCLGVFSLTNPCLSRSSLPAAAVFAQSSTAQVRLPCLVLSTLS